MSSIKNHVLISLIIASILIVGVFYSYYSSFISIGEQYDDYMNRNEKMAVLHILKDEEEKQFQQSLRNNDVQYELAYSEQKDSINQNINELIEESTDRQDILNDLRTIDAMHQYLNSQLPILIKKKILLNEDYENLQLISQIYDNLGIKIQEMIFRDLQISNQFHKENFGKIMQEKLLVFLFVLLGIVLSSSILLFVLKAISKKMTSFIVHAEALENNDWDIEDLEMTKYIELNVLATAFNNMKHRIYENIEEIKFKSELEIELQREQAENERKDNLLKQAQLHNLQMQINPHFLFNTLNIIGKSAVLEDGMQAMQLIEDISKILRYSMSHLDDLVFLSEELEVVKSYISIQRTRFKSQIQFNLVEEINDYNIMIPPMIIQPIIENAIKHGLADKQYNGVINISFKVIEKELVIKICDNGVGFRKDPEKLPKNTSSIGLENVSMRLELQYKANDLLQIESVEDEFTCITMHIPLVID